MNDLAELTEVLAVGMLVPSFTWAVQLSASGLALSAAQRKLYWGDLGRICLLGSVALLPAGKVPGGECVWTWVVSCLPGTRCSSPMARTGRGRGRRRGGI